jgi:hypothetical protein
LDIESLLNAPLPEDWARRRAERVRKNETVFREHNRRRVALEEAAHLPDSEPVPIVCECGDANCWDAVEVTVSDVERAQRKGWFAVKPRHVMPDFERVVEQHEGFWLVEKYSPEEAASRLAGAESGEAAAGCSS